MEALLREAAADSAVLRDAHQLAHALGRGALQANGGDPSVINQCRPDFGAGCFHGVVEAYLNARGRLDMTELERMCTGVGDDARPGVVYECMHGLGHGVLGILGLDYRRALERCDELSRPRFARSCEEGVYMEAIDDAIADHAGQGDHHAHAAGAHHAHSVPAQSRIQINADDPYSPCNTVADAGSCWLFQGFLILRRTGFDAAKTLRTCDGAPESRVRECYVSVGHQLTGLLQRDDQWLLRQCGLGQPNLAPACAGGATLALNAIDWSGERSSRFCAAAPEGWKPTCYAAAASSLALYAPPAAVDRFCVSAGGYAAACRAGLAERSLQ